MITNSQLLAEVQQALEWDPKVDAQHIAVTTKDGAVTLEGYVETYLAKKRAITVVERVQGVKAVADELNVRLHDEHARDDSEIAEAIARFLEWDASLAMREIQATVSEGIVTLTGEVPWNDDSDEAEQSISRIVGVQSVKNHIIVKPCAVAGEVQSEIANALARHAALDAQGITVTTIGNKAVLNGHVRSLEEVRLARKAAFAAPGISHVESHLLVEPNGQ